MLPKDLQEFKATLETDAPNSNWTEALRAMWYDAKGDWHSGHELVDGKNNELAKWVHAFLHRKEGDEWNAGYWYRQAAKPFPKVTLEEEHQEIVEYILNQ